VKFLKGVPLDFIRNKGFPRFDFEPDFFADVRKVERETEEFKKKNTNFPPSI